MGLDVRRPLLKMGVVAVVLIAAALTLIVLQSWGGPESAGPEIADDSARKEVTESVPDEPGLPLTPTATTVPVPEPVDEAPEPEPDEVPDGPTVELACVDALTQEPINSFSASLELEDERALLIHGDNGTAEIPGSFVRLTVSADGYLPRTLPQGASGSRIFCTLEPLSGNGLVLRDGVPVADCPVALHQFFGSSVALGVTDERGRFSFPIGRTVAFDLRATLPDGVGTVMCLPGQESATITIYGPAGLRVMSDEALPAFEVISNSGAEGRHEGGGQSTLISPLVPFSWISVHVNGVGQVARMQLGPPGSEKLLLLPPEVPTVWVHLQDSNGSPITRLEGGKAVLTQDSIVSEPEFEQNPLRVRLSLGSLVSAQANRLDVFSADDVPAFVGYPTGARREGEHWSLRMRPITNLSGVVVGPDGQPAEGARVSVGSLTVEDTAYTDARGEFRLSSPRAGTLHVYAEWRGLRALASGDGTEPLRIELKPSRELAVHASDAPGGFTVAWRASDGPWGAPVSSRDGIAVLRVPDVAGRVQLRSGIYSVERDVSPDSTREDFVFGTGPSVVIRVMQAGEPAGGAEVNGILGARHTGGTTYRVRFFVGADGTAQIMLAMEGMWTFSNSFAAGHLDTSKSTELRMGSPALRDKVKVFGLMNWRPERSGVKLFQTDRVLSEPMKRREFRETGAILIDVHGTEYRTLSYVAQMKPDTPYVLALTPSGYLVQVGTLRHTPQGWRADLTLAPEHLKE
jgi:hypothetical protein